MSTPEPPRPTGPDGSPFVGPIAPGPRLEDLVPPVPGTGGATGTLDLSLPTDDALVAASAPNPRTEREKLAAGNPAEITSLGEVFARAGGDMDEAYELSQQAQRWVGTGYTNDGTPVYDQARHVASLPRDFPDAGGRLSRLGNRLGEIALALDTSTTDATEMLTSMFGVFGQRRTAWAARVDAAAGPDGLIPFADVPALQAERADIAQGMQALADLTGKEIGALVTTYEGVLADGLTLLADIGYLPPDALDTGPGGEGFGVSATAADQEAAVFQAQARAWSTADLAGAIARGDSEQIETALGTAGRLDGAITQANVDHALDGALDDDARRAAEYRAAQIAASADQGLRSALVVAGRELLNDIPGYGSVSAVGAELLKQYVRHDSMPPTAPGATAPQVSADQLAAVNTGAVLQRDLLIAGALDQAGGFGDRPPPRILSTDTTGPQGVADGVVDPPSSSSVLQDELFPAVRQALSAYHADVDAYQDGRSMTYSEEARPAPLPQPTSGWTASDRYYYGDTAAPADVFGTREPDPRVLDDPNYDPLDRAR